MTCEGCGESFVPRNKRGTKARFCSAKCNAQKWRQDNPERMQAIRERAGSKPGVREKKLRSEQLRRDNNPTYFSLLFWKRKFTWVKHLGGCCACGESRLPCLDFDHIDPATKLHEISQMLRYPGRFDEAAVRSEVEKCRLLCANCHRIRTAKHWDALSVHFLI